MTLNLLVLTKDVIYQSTDYQLTDMGTGLPVPAPSTKRVVVSFFPWVGFVTYAGLGRAGGIETADQVLEWMKGVSEATLPDLAELIRRRGTDWIRRHHPGQRHTFVLVGFVQGVATAAVISNYESGQGRPRRIVDPRLSVSLLTWKGRPIVLATGRSDLLTKSQRSVLTRLAERHAREGVRIRRAMAKVNAEVAARSGRTVSAECLIHYQDASGRGGEEAFGGVQTVSRDLMHGVDLLDQIRPLLDSHFGPGQWSMKQQGFGRSVEGDAAEPPPDCVMSIDKPSGTRYRVTFLKMPSGRRAAPHALNQAGVVVGDASPLWRGPSQPCRWDSPDDLVFLPGLGGVTGVASAINTEGTVVGFASEPDGATRACFWPSDGTILCETDGTYSRAVSISPNGNVAGTVSEGAMNRGQQQERPVRWISGEPQVYRDVGDGWANAMQIDDDGTVLGQIHRGTTYQDRESNAFLWSFADFVRIPNPAGCQDLYPMGRTEAGDVIGTAISPRGSREVVCWSPSGEWSTVPLPSGTHLQAVGLDGSIAGRIEIDDVSRPWVMRAGLGLQLLPAIRHHHHGVSAIVGSFLIGTATGDGCAHPMMWSLDADRERSAVVGG